MLSDEEKKIRGELERDVETELEEEIKDGICKLALRLHRLYRDQKQRNNSDKNNVTKSHDNNNNKTLSEVTINIRMEGGTKIEIKEIKKEASDRRRRRQFAAEEGGGVTVAPPQPRAQKFDWTKTLRSPHGCKKQIDKIDALELGWKP